MTVTENRPTQARSNGISYQQLLDTDSREVPDVLRWESPAYLGDQDYPVTQYTSRAFHELEKEKLWSKVWQFACREEEIPDVGDTAVYDICDWSILVVRSAPDTIKAYYNACLHRGRQLREFSGWTNELRCPFHGFCWNLDGSLRDVPAGWDFPHVYERVDEFFLPEVKVGTWGGFVFINMDPDCEPLESFIGDLGKHFERWPLEKRYKQAHVAKIIRCNWKVAQEAFMEAFHVVATHPQLLAGIGDANSQYDVFGNFSRAITPNGTPSPHINWEPTAAADVRRHERPSPRRAAPGRDPRRRDRPPDGRHGRAGDAPPRHRRVGRRADRRRAGRQLLLHAVPQLPSVGRLQPHRLPVPPVPGRARALRHGVPLPGALGGRGAAAAGPGHVPRPRTTTGPRPRSWASWPGCSTRTPSTCPRCRSACGP